MALYIGLKKYSKVDDSNRSGECLSINKSQTVTQSLRKETTIPLFVLVMVMFRLDFNRLLKSNILFVVTFYVFIVVLFIFVILLFHVVKRNNIFFFSNRRVTIGRSETPLKQRNITPIQYTCRTMY